MRNYTFFYKKKEKEQDPTFPSSVLPLKPHHRWSLNLWLGSWAMGIPSGSLLFNAFDPINQVLHSPYFLLNFTTPLSFLFSLDYLRVSPTTAVFPFFCPIPAANIMLRNKCLCLSKIYEGACSLIFLIHFEGKVFT